MEYRRNSVVRLKEVKTQQTITKGGDKALTHKINIKEEWKTDFVLLLSSNNSPVDHSKLVNDEPSTDVVFTIGGRSVRAHRFILEIRCPNLFIIAIKKKTFKKSMVFIEIDEKYQINSNSFLLFIKFLYSSNTQFFGKEISEIVNLVHTAKIYESNLLVQICQWYIYSALDNVNWFTVLRESQRIGLEEVKWICKLWAKYHFTELVVQKSGIDSLGLDLFHEIVLYIHIPQHDEPDLPSLQVLMKSSFQSIIDDFKRVYEEMFRSDGSFRLGDELVLCHRPILLGQSAEMSKLFRKGHTIYHVPEKYEMDAQTFKILLRFLYYSSIDDFNPYIAWQLRPFAMDFGLVNLRSSCENQMKNGINQHSVIEILNLVRQVHYNAKSTRKQRDYAAEVESMCLNLISKSFTSINISQLADANSICDILEIIKSQITSDTRWRYQSDKQILHEVEDALSSVSRKPSLPAPEETLSPTDPGSPPEILTLKRHTHTPPSSPSPPIPKKYKMRTRSGEKRKTGTKISQYRAYSVVDINNRRHSVQRKTTLLNISVPTNSTANGNYEKTDAFSDGDTKNIRNTIK